jgi:hypothetical protein
LIFAVKKSAPTTSSSTEQEEYLKIVYQGLSAGIGVTIVEGNVLLGVGVGVSHGAVVASINQGSTRWQLIPVKTPEQEAFRYASRLDFALTAVDGGDYSTALALLEDAGLHAPSVLEKARSLALMANLTSMVLNDSLGSLQALSLYHETYRTWANAVSEAKISGEEGGPVEEWIKGELTTWFEQYGSAYPEVARALALDPERVRTAEGLRLQRELGKPIANGSEFGTMFDSVKRGFRQYMKSDNARDWFDAERERLARLDPKSLMDEAKEAALRGPEEARWFAETLTDIYAGGLADENSWIAGALARAAEGCTEPWRSQFKEFLTVTVRNLDTMRGASRDGLQQFDLSVKSSQHFGLKNTAKVLQDFASAAHSQTSKPPSWRFDEPPPSVAWWTREYLDWFLATTWNEVTYSQGICDGPSQWCEDELMRKRPYIAADGSENHRLFAPGLGLAMWMLAGQPKIDPWWDHAFYFGIGTHFALWQDGLRGPFAR